MSLLHDIDSKAREISVIFEDLDSLNDEFKNFTGFSLFEDEGSIEWDPEPGKKFRGVKGITRDSGEARRTGVGRGDLVIKVDNGKAVGVGVVLGRDRGGIQVSNKNKPDLFKDRSDPKDFRPADRDNKVVQDLLTRNPGRRVWVFDEKGDHWALPQN